MDLRSGVSVWQADGTPDEPGWGELERDTRIDVLVIGSGITGALVSDALAQHGIETMVIDRRGLAEGSTPASTALLQYEVDTSLVELSGLIGAESAVRAYRLGVRAIEQLESISAEVGGDFQRRGSVYLGRRRRDRATLAEEAAARQGAGLSVRFLGEEDVWQLWNLRARCAIHSDVAAQADPVKLTNGLLRRAASRGVRLCGGTDAVEITQGAGRVVVRTAAGPSIDARWVVCATGYESVSQVREKVVSLSSTFAIATAPMPDTAGWADRALVWEHADPYLYARWTADHRLVVGGEDVAFKNAAARDALIAHKARRLVRKFQRIAPGLSIVPTRSWAGTFGSTRDGLGYIGAEPHRPDVLFALGFGGNGITFSVVARDLIVDTILDRPNADAPLFRFGR